MMQQTACYMNDFHILINCHNFIQMLHVLQVCSRESWSLWL